MKALNRTVTLKWDLIFENSTPVKIFLKKNLIYEKISKNFDHSEIIRHITRVGTDTIIFSMFYK